MVLFQLLYYCQFSIQLFLWYRSEVFSCSMDLSAPVIITDLSVSPFGSLIFISCILMVFLRCIHVYNFVNWLFHGSVFLFISSDFLCPEVSTVRYYNRCSSFPFVNICMVYFFPISFNLYNNSIIMLLFSVVFSIFTLTYILFLK